MHFLLGTRTGILPLLRYIDNIKRLKATFGKVCLDIDFVLSRKRNAKRTTSPMDSESLPEKGNPGNLDA